MLTEQEVEEIRQGVTDGIRGPVMLKWVEMLLRDRDERVAREQAHGGRPDEPK
jgi:hypothetical protein